VKRFVMTLLVGAGFAALTMNAARAEQFTIERVTAPTNVTSGPAGANFSVNFLGIGGESPQADSGFPGTSLTLLNYTVTTPGATPAIGNYNFNTSQPFQIIWRGYGPLAAGQSYVSNFTLNVTGFASRTATGFQDNVLVQLIPNGPADLNFLLGVVPFTVSDFQATDPPIVNDPVGGAISARVVSPIPEPGSMALLGTALLPAIGLIRRRRG